METRKVLIICIALIAVVSAGAVTAVTYQDVDYIKKDFKAFELNCPEGSSFTLDKENSLGFVDGCGLLVMHNAGNYSDRITGLMYSENKYYPISEIPPTNSTLISNESGILLYKYNNINAENQYVAVVGKGPNKCLYIIGNDVNVLKKMGSSVKFKNYTQKSFKVKHDFKKEDKKVGLKDIFDYYDFDKDGYWSFTEFQAFWHAGNTGFTNDNEVFSCCDLNKDGKISFNELKTIIDSNNPNVGNIKQALKVVRLNNFFVLSQENYFIIFNENTENMSLDNQEININDTETSEVIGEDVAVTQESDNEDNSNDQSILPSVESIFGGSDESDESVNSDVVEEISSNDGSESGDESTASDDSVDAVLNVDDGSSSESSSSESSDSYVAESAGSYDSSADTSSSESSGSDSSTSTPLSIQDYKLSASGSSVKCTIYVGSDHAGESVDVSVVYSLDGQELGGDDGSYTVGSDGTIVVTTSLDEAPSDVNIQVSGSSGSDSVHGSV